jgi:hypothetical protein
MPLLSSPVFKRNAGLRDLRDRGWFPQPSYHEDMHEVHVSEFPEQGSPLHLPASCGSGLRDWNVFLLLGTTWFLSLRTHCHMAPGVRNGLLGIQPSPRLSISQQGPFHSSLSLTKSLGTTVLERMEEQQTYTYIQTHTHEWVTSETLRCHHCSGWHYIPGNFC